MNNFIFVLALFSIVSIIPIIQAEAASNSNLFVSAENSKFENHFSGSMIVEVVIRDNNIRETNEGKGEPDVTVNGKTLRMVQATDGNWYAYFANAQKAKSADSTVGFDGEGLDFGNFCSRDTPSSVFGISLSDSDGFFVPRSDCMGTPDSELNNVVRKPKSINTSSPLSGQIGLEPIAWPLIQLFSFSDVTIQYNAAGGAQTVDLEYDDIPNITLNLDRDLYPQNAEVFLTINDFQLNQDPTDEDSWTFNVESPVATFYQAFDSNGQESPAVGTAGLVNLLPHLSSIGFENNGVLSMSLASVMELKSNSDQPETSVDDGTIDYPKIITLVEQGPNSGIFESFDYNDKSTIEITKNAPRGKTGTITYNQDSVSVLTGFSTASVSLQKAELKIQTNSGSLSPGTEYSIILVDPDQNVNANSRDDLDVFRDSSLIPTLKIGTPVTLAKSSNIMIYPNPDNFIGGEKVKSVALDKNSERLFIDTKTTPPTGADFAQISLNLGITASDIRSILLNSDSDNIGTNWINYDFRSIENDFKTNDFSDTEIELHFGSFPDPSPITIVNPGDISSSKGFFQLDDNLVNDILKENGSAFLVINFGSSGAMIISNESNLQPIVFDLFSIGLDDRLDGINNSIYRFELEETGDNSSTFEGTFEYAIANQLNILDANFIRTVRTIDDDVKFFITNRSVDEKGIFISYSDLDKVGISTTVSSRSDIVTHSGVVSTGSSSYRFGQPVTIILNDPDLNLRSDRIDTYNVIDDPHSPNVDTVGSNGVKLLEILIKDIRYKRCTVGGIEYGGLASTGFSLIETGPSTGIFEGVFKMPSQICNKSGTQLISPAGGSIEIKYNDSRDDLGKSSIISSLNNQQLSTAKSTYSSAQLSLSEFQLPVQGSVKEVVLSGSIDNQRRGLPLSITLTHPDGKIQEFSAYVTDSGNYKTIFSFNSNSLPGTYEINLEYAGKQIDSISLNILNKDIPDWIKEDAKWWSSSVISDSEFIDGIDFLIEEKIITIPPTVQSLTDRTIPAWVKNNAKWWSNDQITDDEFIRSIQYLVKKGIIQV